MIIELIKLLQFHLMELHCRIGTFGAQIGFKGTYGFITIHRLPLYMLVVVLAFL